MRYRTAAVAAAGVFALGLAAIFAANARDYGSGESAGAWRGQMSGGPGGSNGQHARAGHGYGHGQGMGHGHGGPGQMVRNFTLFFDMLDVDADNVVTRAEALRPAVQRFARIDTDGDGFVTEAEIGAARASEPGRFSGGLVARFDADADQRVSAAEFAVRARAVFARADANDDGAVSYGEFNMLTQRGHGRGHAMAMPGADMPENEAGEVEDDGDETPAQ